MHIQRLAAVLALAAYAGIALAQTPATPAQPAAAPPLFATTKVTDNVYIFRYGGHQSMFIVTPDGVIATDPIGLKRPAAAAYIAEIRKITQAPIKYVIYSHHHYDHISGGKPFKDLGATFVAHRNAQAHLAILKDPEVVMPDQVVDDKSTIELGGTRVDLIYVGRNHSDNSLVLYLPKEKIIFAVDFIWLGTIAFRDLPDSFLPDYFDSLDRVLAIDWDRWIPGHPGPGGRLGTKDDVRANKAYLTDVSNAARELADKGQCLNDDAMREVKLPKYESLGMHNVWLFGNVERFCEYWGRGY
jgi:glyoxylase-like metal-dependent hydrolase (beta-lactamase superfamily II)